MFEAIMARNFPKLVKGINLQIQETRPNFQWINSNKLTSRHIIKLLKIKHNEKNLEIRENQCILYEEIKIQMTANFSSETMESRRHL